MGIDIYAVWKGQTEEERKRQFEVWLTSASGHIGYLREAYHGEPYATRFLFSEAFASEDHEAGIPAKTLRERLPEALQLVERREREVYEVTNERQIEWVRESFRSFVALCERKEKETGAPVVIRASY